MAFAGGTDEQGGFLEFVDGTTVAQDFASLAGISTDAAPQGAQTKLLHGLRVVSSMTALFSETVCFLVLVL
jgi:hypothetical protein